MEIHPRKPGGVDFFKAQCQAMDWERLRTPGAQDVKVILLGDSSVGKTSILNQFNSNTFQEDTEPTVGAMFVSRQIQTSRRKVNLLIWDTAGQERYRALVPMYSRSASAAILVVDVSSISSYESVQLWYNDIRANCPIGVRTYIVANKIDLPIEIPIQQLEDWAAFHELTCFRSTATDFLSVEAIFRRIAEDFAAKVSDTIAPVRLLATDRMSCC
jgi:small GTP-binding protein